MKIFFRRYGWLYLPGLIFLALSSYLQTLIPFYLGRIVDDLNSLIRQVSAGGSAVFNSASLVAMVLVSLAVFVSRFVWRYLIMGNSRYLETCLRRQLFDHLLKLTPEYFQQQKTGDLMAYAINDIGAIRQTLGPGLALSANAFVMSFLSIRSMSGDVDPQLTLLALIPLPLILVLILFFGRQVRIRFRKVQETFSAVSDRIQESITGIQVIKAYGLENEEVQRFEALNRQSRDAQMRMTAVSASTSPLTSLLFGVSFTIALVQGGQMVINGVISLGSFVAFLGYLALIVSPVQSVARIINLLQKGSASWKRFAKILGVVPAVQDAADVIDESRLPVRSAGHLAVDRLTFSFPNQRHPVLQDVSIEMQPGRRIGILGKTGSGKTTLTSLLVRLFEAPAGSITLDGQDLRRLPLGWLRRQIALVPQDNFLFSATIEENIRFFDPAPSQEDLEAAARLADLHDTIMAFPEGYRTVVGERGVTLSGGQKQRLGLARALLKKAPILVIDDTLSAVDTLTEQRILEGLNTMQPAPACLIIANRVSALQNCDEILVLIDGRISERGTHEQLVALDGFYASIDALQAAGGES